MSEFYLQLRACRFCHAAAILCHLLLLMESVRFSLFGEFRGGSLGKHIESDLHVGHVVAQTFFFKTFEVLVLLGRHSAPLASDDVCESGILQTLLHARTLPFVSEFLSYFDGLDSLIYPSVRISQTLVINDSLVDAPLRVLHLVQTCTCHLRHPNFKRFGLWRWY